MSNIAKKEEKRGRIKVKKATPLKAGGMHSLDTLAQLPPAGLDVFTKRARSKWYTQQIVKHLCDLKSPLSKYYRSAIYCADTITQKGHRFTAKYCNTRCCNICNRIRTAKMINGYLEQVKALDQLSLVTLTIPNCKDVQLHAVIGDMIKSHTLINRSFHEKRNLPVNGLRKLEVTYNAKEDTYHPHLHLLVDRAQNEMVDQWLKRYPEADIKGQDSRLANSSSVKELFKYTTKIVVGSNYDTKDGIHKLEVYVKALDIIFRTLQGRRVFQPFGRIKRVDENVIKLEAQEYTDMQEYTFVRWFWNDQDWYSPILGKSLTGYTPPNLDIEVR